ncbi:glutathione S-transferase [Dyella halodurans]|uniref:Glutathione S-transferase family protein n=1 Tax=Dyella halodurans TaxID=1920171 RepID=A0ABV9C2H8_9GAMM|nr:glutathione S-transferase [Dyella halodurans]
MELYHSPASPNSRRVRVFLAEKGLSIPFREINLGENEQMSDQYRSINPRLQVPALELDDGRVIAEVPAIWRYLEEIHPSTPLLGTDAADKGIVSMWERRVELDGFAATMEGVRNAHIGLKGRALSGPHDYDQILEVVGRSKLRLTNFYADIDARLEDVPFVAGARFSIADITLLVTVDFAATGFSMPIPEERYALRRWYDDVSARPSAKA